MPVDRTASAIRPWYMGDYACPRLHSGRKTPCPDFVHPNRDVHFRLVSSMTDADDERTASCRDLTIAAVIGFLAGYGAVALVSHLIIGYHFTAGTLPPRPCSPGLHSAHPLGEGGQAWELNGGVSSHVHGGASIQQSMLRISMNTRQPRLARPKSQYVRRGQVSSTELVWCATCAPPGLS
jgi:hypothetical protein